MQINPKHVFFFFSPFFLLSTFLFFVCLFFPFFVFSSLFFFFTFLPFFFLLFFVLFSSFFLLPFFFLPSVCATPHRKRSTACHRTSVPQVVHAVLQRAFASPRRTCVRLSALPPLARFLSWVRPHGVRNGGYFSSQRCQDSRRISHKRLSRLAWTMLPPWPTTLGHHWLNCGRGDSAWNLWESHAVVLATCIQTWLRVGPRFSTYLRVVVLLLCAFCFFLLSSSLASPCLPSLSPSHTSRIFFVSYHVR